MTTTIIIAVSDPMTLLFLLLNMKDILVLQIYPTFFKNKELFQFVVYSLWFVVVLHSTVFLLPASVILIIVCCEFILNLFQDSLHRSVILFTIDHSLNYCRFPQLNIRLIHISWDSSTNIIRNQFANG
jgi:hypothetical protein